MAETTGNGRSWEKAREDREPRRKKDRRLKIARGEKL
jgi:hypothetical protein